MIEAFHLGSCRHILRSWQMTSLVFVPEASVEDEKFNVRVTVWVCEPPRQAGGRDLWEWAVCAAKEDVVWLRTGLIGKEIWTWNRQRGF
jgi:hypothetical protein